MLVNEQVVRSLIIEQFPEWQSLHIRPVASSGWDHYSFHLGEHMLVKAAKIG